MGENKTEAVSDTTKQTDTPQSVGSKNDVLSESGEKDKPASSQSTANGNETSNSKSNGTTTKHVNNEKTLHEKKSETGDKKTESKSKSNSTNSTKTDKKDQNPSNSSRSRDKKSETNDTNTADNHSKSRSKSRSARGKSRSPGPRGSRYSRTDESKGNRSSSRTRSPVRRRSPPRRRNSIDYRYSRDIRRPIPPRRRSRSPRRTGSRPYRRSPVNDSKSLIAKKNFLDDLAVIFAQEGKEFPELEQYRCEINNQFDPSNNYMPAPEPGFVNNGVHMHNQAPMDMPNPYDAYLYPSPTIFPDSALNMQSFVSYPIAGMQPPPPPFQQEIPQHNIPLVANPVPEQCQMDNINDGMIPSDSPPEIFTKLEVETNVNQAVRQLEDLAMAINRSAKFMYRTPTFYDSQAKVNEHRSPLIQSPTNPLFAFTNRSGASNNPFGNISAKHRQIIEKLCLDEGRISYKISLRHRNNNAFNKSHNQTAPIDERSNYPQIGQPPAVMLQKQTQTDPTVCTQCLVRKLKTKADFCTQTPTVPKYNAAVQTNPVPKEKISEFGSITELTPNQVRAVSELIKYIKLTGTSGSLEAMRNSMQEDRVYSLNNDLRTGYQYFDAMVKHNNAETQPKYPPKPTFSRVEQNMQNANRYNEYELVNKPKPVPERLEYQATRGNMYTGVPENNKRNEIIEGLQDDESIDEYEKFHQNFCDDDNLVDKDGPSGQDPPPQLYNRTQPGANNRGYNFSTNNPMDREKPGMQQSGGSRFVTSFQGNVYNRRF